MNPQPTVQLPGQWSTVAPEIDRMYYFIFWLSVVFFVGICAAAVYFVWKYRRRPGVKAAPTGHNNVLEIGWTVAPIFLLIGLFHYGFKGWMNLRVPPGNAYEIRVQGHKWLWTFSYPNGMTTPELHVPVGRPVRLVLSSDDVIHSFYVPAFRAKQDAVPGYYQTMWFEATHTGTTDFFCAEFCGTGHSAMHGNVVIQTQAEFDRWLIEGLRAPAGVTPAGWGQMLYTQYQCNTCHSVSGTPGTGPTWQHLYDHPVPLADGSTVAADRNYLRESILQPNAKIVRGFQSGLMPTFQGTLRDNQVDALIEYIRTLQ